MRGLGCGAEPRGRAKQGGERARQGLEALDYAEHTDYDLVESTNPAFNKALVRINVFRAHRQARAWPARAAVAEPNRRTCSAAAPCQGHGW